MERLPGEDLVQEGVRALGNGETTVESLLVSSYSQRLKKLGHSITAPIANPRERLYALLAEKYGDGAHSRFNALQKRIDSYCSAAACVK